MKTREEHLRNELRSVENAQDNIQKLLNRPAWDTKERAHLQAQLDVLTRRHRTLRQLLASP